RVGASSQSNASGSSPSNASATALNEGRLSLDIRGRAPGARGSRPPRRGRGRRSGKLVASASVLLALSSAQKAGLAGMGSAFIVFALISSMLIPRYRPEFPARLLGVFLGLVGLFTAAMLLTVFFVARESGEEAAAKPGETTATTGTATTPGTETTPAAPAGNPAAGKALFAAQGCVSCHTFKPAGATGKVGPDLDHLAADA